MHKKNKQAGGRILVPSPSFVAATSFSLDRIGRQQNDVQSLQYEFVSPTLPPPPPFLPLPSPPPTVLQFLLVIVFLILLILSDLLLILHVIVLISYISFSLISRHSNPTPIESRLLIVCMNILLLIFFISRFTKQLFSNCLHISTSIVFL